MPSWPRGSAGWWWAHPIRTPGRRRRGRRAPGGRAGGRGGGGARVRRESSWPPTSSTAGPGGPGWCSSWPPPWTADRRPDGSSRGSPEQRPADAHRLRARSDAVAVGAGTVRADDPALTVRLLPEARGSGRRPAAPGGARSTRRPAPGAPALELAVRRARSSTSSAVGGCCRCSWRAAPRSPMASTPPGWWTATCSTWPRPCSEEGTRAPLRRSRAPTVDRLWRGRLHSVTRLGDDLRIELTAPVH